MIDPNANANAARARMRQQQYLRLALLLCMTMLLMDPSSNSNRGGAHRPPTNKASTLRGSGSGAGTTPGTPSYESELASINQRYEVLLDPTDTKGLNTLLSKQFPTKKTTMELEAVHNVTGVYRGAWAHSTWVNVSLPKEGVSVLGSGGLRVLRPENEGTSLIQLRSVPIHNVQDVKYVYGILKMYAVPTTVPGITVTGRGLPASTLQHLNVSTSTSTSTSQSNSGASSSQGRPSSSSSGGSYASRLEILKSTMGASRSTEDVAFPVQGIHVPATSECVLVITPSRSHRVYVGVRSPHPPLNGDANNKKQNPTEGESASSAPSPPPLNPDGTSRSDIVKQKRQMQKRINAGEDAGVSAIPLSGEGGLRVPRRGEGKKRRKNAGFRRGRQVDVGHRHLAAQIHPADDSSSSPLPNKNEDLPKISSLVDSNSNEDSVSLYSTNSHGQSIQDAALAVLTAVWPLPISMIDLLQYYNGEAWTINTTDINSTNNYFQKWCRSMVSGVLESDLTVNIREAVGARERGSVSLITLLRGINAKDNVVQQSTSSSSAVAVLPNYQIQESFDQLLYDSDTVDMDEEVVEPRKLQESSVDTKEQEAVAATSAVLAPNTHHGSLKRLDDSESNLFVLREHMSLLPTDSFMKAVHRKATVENVVPDVLAPAGTSTAKKMEILKKQGLPRAIPYFYAERYPLKTVPGLELLLVDVDHSSRSQQLPAHMASLNKESPAAKKLSAQMEKMKEKFIPPSSIPGGLGAATMSNSFQSFLATTGVSKQWASTIRCTFSLRLLMSSGRVLHSSEEDRVKTLLRDITTRSRDSKKSADMPSKDSANRTGSNGAVSNLPVSIYEKHTKTGNKIRQLQSTLMGNVVSSACSYPLCSGRGLADSSSHHHVHHLANSNEFSIVASFYKIDFKALESKLATYTLVYTAICVYQSYLLITQMYAASNQAVASRISILSISAMAVLDAAICILHLLLSSVVSGNAFYYFLWLSFLKLVVFCILEMRFVISIFQARYAQEMAQNGWTGLRNHLATLHARFYGALFLVILLVDWYYTRPLVLVFVLYSFWLPQIAFSAYTGGPAPPLSLDFSINMTLSRLFFPLYTLACPHNFLTMLTDKFQVSFMSAEATLLWLGLQLAVVYSQHKFGVRFFVPQHFLPVRYNYSRSIAHLFESGTDTEQESNKECVICYNAIEQATERGASDYMVTPCDHLFHRECLSQWLDVKLECPVCRATLPLDED